MFTLETEMAEDAWKTILNQIMEHGTEVEDERDLITKGTSKCDCNCSRS